MNLRGHTLLELLIVLAVVGLLGSLGWPGFSAMIDRIGLRADAQTVLNALHRARLGAIHRRAVTVVCALGASDACGSDWRAGILVFADLNANTRRDGDEPLLWRSPPLRRSSHAELRIFGRPRAVRYQPNGTTRRAGASFVLCDRTGARLARIVLSAAGRMRLEWFGDDATAPVEAAVDSRGRGYRCVNSG